MKLSVIALRNLTRQKRRSLLLASAIAFGVMIVIAVNAFSAGAIRILKENVADMVGGHVFINLEQRVENKTVTIIDDDTKLLDALHAMGIKDEQLRKSVAMSGSLIFGGKKSTVQVLGNDWSHDTVQVKSLGIPGDVLEDLLATKEGIVISRKTADELSISLGDSVMVKGKTVYGQENVGEFIVKYITQDKSMVAGMMAFSSHAYVSELLNLPNETSYQTLRVRLDSLDMATPFALQLKESLKKTMVLASEDNPMANFSFDSNVFKMGGDDTEFDGVQVRISDINSMLDVFNKISDGLALASFILLVFLLIIIMIGISNTFRMILYERTQEIGTMRAVGMFSKDVGRLFLLEAFFLAMLGVGIGIILAALLMFGLGLFNFGTDAAFAMLLQSGHFFFRVEPLNVIICVVLVAGFTLLAARGPAKKAAKLAPADALRTNY